MMGQGWLVPPDSYPVCGGSGHSFALTAGGTGTPPPGTVVQGPPPGGILIAFRVSHCERCGGTGKDPNKAKLVLDPNAPPKVSCGT